MDVTMRGAMDLLLSAGFDGHVGVWDITKRSHSMPRLELLFAGHTSEVLALKVSELSGTFVTGGNDCAIRVWSLRNYELQTTLRGHAEPVTTLALDANFLFSGSEVKCAEIASRSHEDDRVKPASRRPDARPAAGRHGAPVGHVLSHAARRAERTRRRR